MSQHRSTVVQVIPHARMGGMQEVAYALDGGLPAAGVVSSIVDLEKDLQAFPGRTGLPRYWNSLRSRWRRDRPDAVMAHTMKNALFTLPAALAAGVGRRVVVVHNSRPVMGCPKTVMLAVLAGTGVCTDVVYCGRAAGDTYSGLPGRVHRVARVIQNGIRLPEATGAEQAEPTSATPELIVAGRLTPVKNVDVAIRAVMLVDRPVVLHVYGDGEQRAELEALVASSRWPERIVFHGAVRREVLDTHYRQAAALLFPSAGEGLPLVLIEAAAAGMPVIASSLPCNLEVLGDAGAYADSDDPAEWAGLVQAVLDDPARRAAMVAAGHERVGHFTVERMVAGYARLLTDRG